MCFGVEILFAYRLFVTTGASIHVRMADEAVALNESGVQAYLNRCVAQAELAVEDN